MRSVTGITIARVVVLVFLLMLGAAASYADDVPAGDPLVGIGGVDPAAPAGIITPDFTITSPSGSSPATSACVLSQPAGSATPIVTTDPSCVFQNDITTDGVGNYIASLTIDFAGVSPSTVNCESVGVTIFADCGVSGDGSGGTLVSFTDGMISYQEQFEVALDGFAAGTVAAASAQLPEPGTVGLLGMGLVGVGLLGFIRRRSLRQAV